MANLRLEFDETNQRQFGPCECCGNMTSRVWGYVYEDETSLAVYYVEWTPGHDEAGAAFDLILGKWGDEATAADRWASSLEFRNIESGASFRVVDASKRWIAKSSLIGRVLDRDEIIGRPVADEIFAICDAIYDCDPRIDEVKG
jgi:hypothetical protein